MNGGGGAFHVDWTTDVEGAVNKPDTVGPPYLLKIFYMISCRVYLSHCRPFNTGMMCSEVMDPEISLAAAINCTASFSLLPSTYSRTRGHNFNLRTGKIRCETPKNFFCNRVVRSWNSLPVNIVNTVRTETMKTPYYFVITNNLIVGKF